MLTAHAKRTVVITIRMTEIERDAIIARATRAGKSVSDYVRGAAMHYASTSAQPEKTITRFLSSADGRGGA